MGEPEQAAMHKQMCPFTKWEKTCEEVNDELIAKKQSQCSWVMPIEVTPEIAQQLTIVGQQPKKVLHVCSIQFIAQNVNFLASVFKNMKVTAGAGPVGQPPGGPGKPGQIGPPRKLRL